MSLFDPLPRRERLSRLPAFDQYGEAQREMEQSFAETSPNLRRSGPFYAVPDDDPFPDDEPGSALPRRGILPGAVAGFVAVAAALGAANLAAVFIRKQASPTIAVGGVFLGRAPSWMKSFAVQQFGANNDIMLLGVMYAVTAILAVAIGILSWRHMSVGVAALAFFGTISALVAATRPLSHSVDIIPSIVGGLVGIAAIIVLIRTGHSLYRALGRG